MTTYYVRTDGNNGNTGTAYTSGGAWLTIQYAVNTIAAGDIIRVGPGVYTECITITSGGSSGSIKTLEAYDSANLPEINFGGLSGGQRPMMLYINNCSYWTIDGLSFQDYPTGGVYVNATTTNVTNITIQNCEFLRQDTNGVLPTPAYQHVIVINGDDPYSASYCYIKDNLIQDTVTGKTTAYNETITMHHNVHHVLIEGNTLLNTSYICLNAIASDYIYGTGTPRYIIFRNNYIDFVRPSAYARQACYIDGGDDILYEKNIIKRANGINTSIECWSSKGSITAVKRHIIRNNVIDNTDGNGFLCLLPGAEVYTAFTAGDPPVVNWVQLYVEDAVMVHNVAITSNSAGAAVRWYVGRRTTLKNNVLVQKSGTKVVDVRTGVTDLSWSEDYNLYYSPNGSVTINWVGGSAYSLSGYRTATGYSQNSIEGAPTYEDTANDDYRLAIGSNGYQAGGALTTAVGSGSSSTSLTVKDARYFTNGYGLITGDSISVGGTAATVSNVDYTNKVLTLSSAISWSDGDDVGYTASPSMGIITMGDTAPPTPQPVTADAGVDQVVTDSDENGSESVTLNGGGSYTDGTQAIASYGWTSDSGVTIPNGATPTATFPQGVHTVTLTVTDDATPTPNTDTDTVIITVAAPRIQPDSYVVNPCLNGTSSWELYAAGNTTWTGVTGGGLEVECTTDGGNTQLYQPGLQVQSGDRVKVRFVATADSTPTDIDLYLHQDQTPWANLGLSTTATIGTTETIFEQEFIVSGSESNARLRCWFTTGDHVTIKELNLLTYDADGCYTATGEDPDPTGSMTLTITDGGRGAQTPDFYNNGTTTYIVGDINASQYDYFAALRFTTNAAIPDGATITSAYLTLQTNVVSGTPSITVKTENTISATAVSGTSSSDYDGRTWVDSVAWTGIAGSGSNQSPSMVTPIQNLVDGNSGIANGSTLQFALDDATAGWFGSARWIDIDGNGGAVEPTLYIAWSAAPAYDNSEETNPVARGVAIGTRVGY